MSLAGKDKVGAALKILAKSYGIYFNGLALVSKETAAKAAFSLFSTPRKGRLLAQQKSYLDQFTQEKVLVADHQLQTYHWKGSKPTVLLCHGWESNAFRWRNLIEKLQSADFNIIVFDAPAHGASSGKHLHVPIYESCATALIAKYKPTHVVGHSIGGLSVLYSQYKTPQESVKKLVSLGAPSELSEIMNNYQRLLGFNNRVLEAMDAYFKKRFAFGIGEFSMSTLAKDIKTEGLLVHDIEDKIAPYSAAVRIQKNWKKSQLISTQGLGHSLHQEDVNNKIISFLEAS